jgi:pimeloyl-ACP methyl ester carboxylesterase
MIDRVEIEVGKRKVIGNLFVHNGKRESVVILLHGFLSSKEDMFSVAEALQKAGIDSLAIDYNGHGESEGEFSNYTVSAAVDDCKAAIEYALSNGYSSVGIFGFSIGGFVALNVAKSIPRKIKALVLGSPVSDFTALFGRADLQDWKSTGMLRSPNMGLNIHLDYKFFEDGTALNGYGKFSKIEIPSLILHGTKDEVVPPQQSEELAKTLKNAHLLRITNATHVLFSNDEAVDSLVKWFKANL